MLALVRAVLFSSSDPSSCLYAKGIIDLVSVPYPVPRSLGSLALFAHGKNGSGS